MSWSIDARIQVQLGDLETAGPDCALLIEGEDLVAPAGMPVERFMPAASPGAHPSGCACCTPRSSAATALARLFLARARGETPFFRRVVAVVQGPEGAGAVRAALAGDPVCSARYRLETRSSI